MNNSLSTVAIPLVIAFIAGFSTHFLYKRWQLPAEQLATANVPHPGGSSDGTEPQHHQVIFVPEGPAAAASAELPLLQARDIEKIRDRAGSQVHIRGRVFRVGHSARSNTYFLNFGPSRDALTAVIFASAVESFEKRKLAPKGFEGKEIEIKGVVKDHPQYGLELILESPAQIRIVN